jgi:hypothetical protein
MARMLHPKPSLRLEPRGAFEGISFDELDWDPIDQEFWESADSAERLVRRFLVFCESPRTRARALALVRGSVAGGRTGRRVYAFVNRLVVHPLLQAAGIKASALRMELVASQLIGMAMMRYVLEVEPMASATPDEIVELMAPSIRAALAKGDRQPAEPAAPVDLARPEEADEPPRRVESGKHRGEAEPESWFDDFHEFADETLVLPRGFSDAATRGAWEDRRR